MEISEKLQEQQTKAEELFSEAARAQREFISMAVAEGLSQREIRRRTMYLFDGESEERDGDLLELDLVNAFRDEGVEDLARSLDKVEGELTTKAELTTNAEPEDMGASVRRLWAEHDRGFRAAMKAYAEICLDMEMWIAETEFVANALGRDLPDTDDDLLSDDLLE